MARRTRLAAVVTLAMINVFTLAAGITVARMREFYRPREPELEQSNVELNRLVQQVIELTRARWSDQPQRRGIMIELKTELASSVFRFSVWRRATRKSARSLPFGVSL